MAGRTTLGSENSKEQALNAVDNLLASELTNPTAYGAMAAAARLELIRRSIVLLLRIAKRTLAKG